MNVIWIILAVLSFLGGQVFLLYRLRKFGSFLEDGPKKSKKFTYDDSYRYPDEDVVE